MTTADLAALRDQLMLHEGFKRHAYRCTAGKITIGVGRNLEDKGLSAAEVTLLLDHDIDECLTDLQSFWWFDKLDAVRQRALVDLRFNLGPYRFRTFKKMLTALESGDFATAAGQARQSAWYGQVQPTRAARVVAMLATGQEA